MARRLLATIAVLMLAACATDRGVTGASGFRITSITIKAPPPESFFWKADANAAIRPRDCSFLDKIDASTEYTGYPENTVEECEAAKARIIASSSGFRDEFEAVLREELETMAARFDGEDELSIDIDVTEFFSREADYAHIRANYKVDDVRTGANRVLTTGGLVAAQTTTTQALATLMSGETRPDALRAVSKKFAQEVCKNLTGSISLCP